MTGEGWARDRGDRGGIGVTGEGWAMDRGDGGGMGEG